MLHVIYDGDCALCVRVLRVFARADVFRHVQLHDSRAAEGLMAAFPALAGADFNEAMYAVGDAGTVSRGFFAFRALAWASPITWPLLLLFYAPGVSVIGPRIYAWVARNRPSLGCKSGICPVPPAGAIQRNTGTSSRASSPPR